MKHHIASIIKVRNPRLSTEMIQTAAKTSVQIVKAMLPLALDGPAKQREVRETEPKLDISHLWTEST